MTAQPLRRIARMPTVSPYGMSWVPAGVAYATDLAEPERSELREILVRMLRALDAPSP